jgi:intracellular multiplication protein IcmQ
MMNTLSKEQASAALKILDLLLSESKWNETNFYRAMSNKLHAMRDNFANALSLNDLNNKLASHMVNRIATRNNQQEIFIGLYVSDGTNALAWEKILSNLPGQLISRPIYAEESQIQAVIKTKSKPLNEAYVSIYVDRNAFITVDEDKVPLDKLGQKMLILKNNSINLENIHFFVHMFKRYQYSKGRLVDFLSF